MMKNSLKYDYIVIGSGFGGSVSAMRLAEKGYSVLILEMGKRYKAEDFPKSNWNFKKFLWMPSLRFFGFQKIDFFSQAMVLSGVGVGGGSLVYANTHMYPPDSFFQNPVWAGFQDWKQSLEPYYQKARFMLGSVPYKKVFPEDEILKEVADDMGRGNTWKHVDGVGVYFGPETKTCDPYFKGLGPDRNGCRECAGCMVGCRYNAKNSLDKNYLWFAEKFGACILSETIADKIEYADNTYRVYTKALRKGKKQVFESKGLIVSAGVLGTLKLLFRQKYDFKTLPGLSDTLGQNLLTNSESLSGVVMADRKLNNGIAINRVFHPDDHTFVELCKYPDGSGLMAKLGTLAVGPGNGLLRILKLLGQIIGHPVRFIKSIFGRNLSEKSLFFLVMQSSDNKMSMRWKKGLLGRKLSMHNPGKKVPAFIPKGQEVMHRFAQKVNGIPMNAISEIAFNLSSTAHILGGCPMGKSIEDGVVDEYFKVHGYPNMLILDGSVMPCNLGVNPSLTISALSEYAMARIPEKKGNRYKTLDEQLRDIS